jgi:hypothetical protein
MHRFLVASAVLLAACASSTPTPETGPGPGTEDATMPPEGTETETEPATPVAYTDVEVQELLNAKCVRCHAGATTVLDLRSFASNTIGVPSSKSGKAECSDSKTPIIIAPGDRNGSLLWHKVTGTQDCGDPMPPPTKGVKLTATELEGLGLYIDGLSTE